MGNCLNDGDYDSVENPRCKYIFQYYANNIGQSLLESKKVLLWECMNIIISVINSSSMNEFYEFKKEIGKGATGSVFLCVEKGVGMYYRKCYVLWKNRSQICNQKNVETSEKEKRISRYN